MSRIDRTGKTFGRLRVTGWSHTEGKVTYWLCRCSCGTETTVRAAALASGGTASCGCLAREKASQRIRQRNFRHGHTYGDRAREYRAWKHMLARCYDPTTKSFPHYGGRGISVCEEWRESFDTFFGDMGNCPVGLTLDRVDNDGNYCASNCAWRTHVQQNRNKRTNVIIKFDGQEKTRAEWAERYGIPNNVLRQRLIAGWPLERAVTAPLRAYTGRKQEREQDHAQ